MPIVVLGGGINYNIPGKDGELSKSSLERIVRGYKLQNKLGSLIIYSGGVAVGQTGISEADIAQKWLQEMEVPENKIIKEDRARTTYENGIYVKKWIKNNDSKSKCSALHCSFQRFIAWTRPCGSHYFRLTNKRAAGFRESG